MKSNVNIATLQRFEPLAPNLFQVEFFRSDNTDTGFNFDSSVENRDTSLYCTGFELPMNTFSYERNIYSKKFLMKDVKLSGQVTINWVEDSRLSVWRFHQAWFSRYYNRSTDTFVPGAPGKKLQAQILYQQFRTEDNKKVISATHKITLYGLAPLTSFPLRGGWGEQADWKPIPITYQVDNIEIVLDAGTLTEEIRRI